ncbi:unnamed protein product [Anisakis simplex]|uniref:Transposase n=1 Tax=Anisakis simplex TaxID=6269 RepID=A0A0M3JX04_ANISI|nr:unnamed protein product [Anisakis simplex]
MDYVCMIDDCICRLCTLKAADKACTMETDVSKKKSQIAAVGLDWLRVAAVIKVAVEEVVKLLVDAKMDGWM